MAYCNGGGGYCFFGGVLFLLLCKNRLLVGMIVYLETICFMIDMGEKEIGRYQRTMKIFFKDRSERFCIFLFVSLKVWCVSVSVCFSFYFLWDCHFCFNLNLELIFCWSCSKWKNWKVCERKKKWKKKKKRIKVKEKNGLKLIEVDSLVRCLKMCLNHKKEQKWWTNKMNNGANVEPKKKIIQIIETIECNKKIKGNEGKKN